MATELSVTRRTNESMESLISRFRHMVDSEGILKDYKLNVMFSREERARFKQFSKKRRSEKKTKRVQEAMGRSGNIAVKRKKEGVV